MIRIEKVETKKQTKQFVDFPLKLYKGCPYYVPQMYGDEIKVFKAKNRDTKKYYLEAFLAKNEKGEVVGRVAAILHKQFNKLYNDKRVRFSRIDFVDNFEVSKALINEVESFAKRHGCHTVCGPMGAIDQDREGLLTEGFNRISTFALNYNYPYYKTHVEKLGYTQEVVWNEKIVETDKIDLNRFARLSAVVLKRSKLQIVKEPSVRKLIKKYKYQIFDLQNETYGHLYGYVPLSHEDVDKLIKTFKIAIRRDYICLVEDENGRLTGFSLAMPSIAQAVHECRGKLTPKGIFKLLRAINHPTVMENLLIGVREEYRSSGIAVVLMNELIQNATKNGIKLAESNAQLLNNKDIQSIYENLNPTVVRFRAAYVKKLKNK